jgi:two-component system, LytTR family, response regulator
MRVLIVDDEPPARRKVRRFLEGDREVKSIAEAGCGADAIVAIERFEPHIVFLDVQMPDIDGFAVLSATPQPHHFHVVFLTAYSEHALRAFDAEALDYLVKPVSSARFERSLERAKSRLQEGSREVATPRSNRFLKRLIVESAGREVVLPVERIDWIEADRNSLRIHSGERTFTIRCTLDQFARDLDDQQFVRVNRSQLVNLDRIHEMQPWFHGERRIVLKDGRELMWTRRFRPAFRTAVPRRADD